VKAFTSWFDSQPFAHRVFIAGNHDTSLDTKYYADRGHQRFHSLGKSTRSPAEISADSVNIVRSATSTYLQDESAMLNISSVEGGDGDKDGSSSHSIKVFGSPWSSEFCDWAFNVDRGQSSIETWARIPSDTDVLITHGPPIGFGDRTQSGFRCGCEDLMRNIRDRAHPPRVHIFGHIHEDRGASSSNICRSFSCLVLSWSF